MCGKWYIHKYINTFTPTVMIKQSFLLLSRTEDRAGLRIKFAFPKAGNELPYHDIEDAHVVMEAVKDHSGTWSLSWLQYRRGGFNWMPAPLYLSQPMIDWLNAQ